MKKLFALVALVLGVVSCQKDHAGMDVNMGGEQEVMINVSLPEDTRSDSAVGAFGNVDFNLYDVRFQCEVHYNGEKKSLEPQYSDNGKTATFPVRLIPGRKYTFVVWADLVEQGETTDLHYKTTDGLSAITLKGEWNAMDDTRDAYTCSEVHKFTGTSNISLTLKRPFAKLRVKTTDMEELLGVDPAKAKVTYTTNHYDTFNAFEQAPENKNLSKIHNTFDIVEYTENEGENKKTLFTDYFFATAEQEVVNFTLEVFENDETPIITRTFNTAIPVKRNNLTTIEGDILTYGDNITVEIKPEFDNAGDKIDDAPFYQVAVSNGFDLVKALYEGREIIVLNDITVTAADVEAYLATRAATAINPVLNLNGFTITIENNNSDALVNLNGGTLTVEGEGAIESTAGALVEGTTVVTEGATVEAEVAVDENGNSAVKTGIEALTYVLANGGEFTFTENIDSSESLLVTTANPIVINGANFTLTSAATRAIRIDSANANVVVNDLNVVVTTERVYPNDIRGISINPELSNVELTFNNCSVDFTHKTGNDWTYAVNISGNGTGHKVTINGGTYNGANVVNVHGASNTIVVKNATLTSLYPNNDVYYGACIWVLQKQNSSVYAEGNTFNGDNALAFNLGTGTALEEKNNTDNTKYVAAKVNGAYYYNIAEAIAAAEDGATIKVLQSHNCNVGATVPAGKTLTIDLNGKTVNGTDTITGSFGLITNKGNLTITGNGKMTLKAENNREWNAYSSVISNTVGGKLVVENGTIEHLGGTDMAYGIDNLTNGKGTYAETVINGGTIKSTYRAVRMFLNGIEAQNLLTVNGGIIEGANKSIWMQDPSKNANTGKLVVNEGATLNGDVYLFVTAGSTEWPVEVSIAASAVNGEVMTGNVPAGYDVVKKNGVWTVITYTEVSTADELIAALEAKENVLFKNDITVAATKGGYNKAGILQNKCQTINGNGYALTVTGAGATWDCAIYTNGGVIKNLTVKGAMRGIFTAGTSADLYIENVKFENVIYTFNSDGGNKNYGVYVSDSVVNGWTSHSNVHKEVVYTNCSFGEGSGYKFCRPYGPTSFVNCTFCPGYTVDQSQTTEITFTNCTFEE